MTERYQAPNWSTAPISRTCHVWDGPRRRRCEASTTYAYPSRGGGWATLCEAHAAKHHPHCFSLADLLEQGETLEPESEHARAVEIAAEAFRSCVMMCASSAEFVAEFDRLTGSNLSGRGTPIELMVDEATGRLHRDAERFVAFVRDVVWDRLPFGEVKA